MAEREKQECFICGGTVPHGIHSHHVVPQEYGGSDKDENLVDLCASCHSAIHKMYGKRFYRELGVEGASSNPTGAINILESIEESARKLHPSDSYNRGIDHALRLAIQEIVVESGLLDEYCLACERWTERGMDDRCNRCGAEPEFGPGHFDSPPLYEAHGVDVGES